MINVALLVTASSVEAEGGYHLPMNDEKFDFEKKKKINPESPFKGEKFIPTGKTDPASEGNMQRTLLPFSRSKRQAEQKLLC